MSDYSYFKFKSINKYMIESIVDPSLYFASPATLNDPFDCRLKLDNFLGKAIPLAKGRTKLHLEWVKSNTGFEKWESKFNSVGVCAFSLCSSETLMWSHYADDHKGACILYRIPESFILDNKNKIIGVDVVTYNDDAIMGILATMATVSPFEFIQELTKSYLTTKSPSWKYENEARIIREEPGLLRIPGEFVQQVCFGLQTAQADIDLISKLTRTYCGCANFCRMARNESDFGFSMRELV
jgi:hypothetical protein